MKETLTHHAIKASRIEDAHGPAILLEQDDTTEAYSVIVHPWQLLAVCQHFGLIAGTGEAQKAVRTLQRRLLALDFSAVEYISSIGLRALMLAARQVKAQGGRIAIVALTPVVADVLRIARFDLVFPIFGDLETATKNLT